MSLIVVLNFYTLTRLFFSVYVLCFWERRFASGRAAPLLFRYLRAQPRKSFAFPRSLRSPKCRAKGLLSWLIGLAPGAPLRFSFAAYGHSLAKASLFLGRFAPQSVGQKAS